MPADILSTARGQMSASRTPPLISPKPVFGQLRSGRSHGYFFGFGTGSTDYFQLHAILRLPRFITSDVIAAVPNRAHSGC